MGKLYEISIRCYFNGQRNYTTHYQTMPLKDVAKWVEAYRFTHPNVEAITFKLWMKDEVTQ